MLTARSRCANLTANVFGPNSMNQKSKGIRTRPVRRMTLADWTGMVEAELFAQTHKRVAQGAGVAKRGVASGEERRRDFFGHWSQLGRIGKRREDEHTSNEPSACLTISNGRLALPFLASDKFVFIRILSRLVKHHLKIAIEKWWRRRELNPRPKQTRQPRLHA